MSESIKSESTSVFSRGLGESQMRSGCFMGAGFLWGDENVLELDRVDGHATW